MNSKILIFILVALPILSSCNGLSAPSQYDHAMPSKYFDKSKGEIEKVMGKPSSIGQNIQNTTYTYSTVDGDLVFRFNQDAKVSKIIYLGHSVSRSAL